MLARSWNGPAAPSVHFNTPRRPPVELYREPFCKTKASIHRGTCAPEVSTRRTGRTCNRTDLRRPRSNTAGRQDRAHWGAGRRRSGAAVRWNSTAPGTRPRSTRSYRACSRIVSLDVDVILGLGGVPASAATKIAVIFLIVTDPVAIGLVKAYERPGGNVTGITSLDPQQPAKQVALLKEMLRVSAACA
jgi:ABC transporter substrate binding protein